MLKIGEAAADQLFAPAQTVHGKGEGETDQQSQESRPGQGQLPLGNHRGAEAHFQGRQDPPDAPRQPGR